MIKPLPFSAAPAQLRIPFLLAAWMAFLCLESCQKETYSQGEMLYRIHCENCHMEDGSGLGRLIPPLDSSKLTLSDPEKLICLIRKGKPVNPLTGQTMPANAKINEVELTNLVNFLGSRYASNPQTVQVPEVKKMLSGCQTD